MLQVALHLLALLALLPLGALVARAAHQLVDEAQHRAGEVLHDERLRALPLLLQVAHRERERLHLVLHRAVHLGGGALLLLFLLGHLTYRNRADRSASHGVVVGRRERRRLSPARSALPGAPTRLISPPPRPRAPPARTAAAVRMEGGRRARRPPFSPHSRLNA